MSAHSTRSDVSGWGSPGSLAGRAGRPPGPRRHDCRGVRRGRGAEQAHEARAEAEFVKSFSDAGSQVLQVSRRRKVRAEKL